MKKNLIIVLAATMVLLSLLFGGCSKEGIKPGETTDDLEYSLETVACFGACALAPVVVENDKVHGRMAAQKVKTIINAETDSVHSET